MIKTYLTYCPSNEGSYKLLFDILEEVVDVKLDYVGKLVIVGISVTYPCADILPNDIEISYWYHDHSGTDGYDEEYHKRGFKATYGNFDGKMKSWKTHIKEALL